MCVPKIVISDEVLTILTVLPSSAAGFWSVWQGPYYRLDGSWIATKQSLTSFKTLSTRIMYIMQRLTRRSYRSRIVQAYTCERAFTLNITQLSLYRD